VWFGGVDWTEIFAAKKGTSEKVRERRRWKRGGDGELGLGTRERELGLMDHWPIGIEKKGGRTGREGEGKGKGRGMG